MSEPPLPPPGFDELSVEKQVQYLEHLWDRIASDEERMPVPDWHLDVLRDRLARYETEAGKGRAWSDVRDELLRELVGRQSAPA